jgi:hypothetical protein
LSNSPLRNPFGELLLSRLVGPLRVCGPPRNKAIKRSFLGSPAKSSPSRLHRDRWALAIPPPTRARSSRCRLLIADCAH